MQNKITCFISFSHNNANNDKFEKIKSLVSNSNYYIDYSERKDKHQYSDETIWNYLKDRISGSSCTILLLTEDILSYNKYKINYEDNNFINSGWIYNEISASLRDWKDNRINGLVCVVDDLLIKNIKILNGTIYGYDLPEILKVNWDYIVFASYSDFIKDSYKYLSKACYNREEQIESNGKAFTITYDLHNQKLQEF